jgi:hypothetical protein
MLLTEDLDEVLRHGEVIVTATNSLSREELLSQLNCGQYLIDVNDLDQPVLKAPALAGS